MCHLLSGRSRSKGAKIQVQKWRYSISTWLVFLCTLWFLICNQFCQFEIWISLHVFWTFLFLHDIIFTSTYFEFYKTNFACGEKQTFFYFQYFVLIVWLLLFIPIFHSKIPWKNCSSVLAAIRSRQTEMCPCFYRMASWVYHKLIYRFTPIQLYASRVQ